MPAQIRALVLENEASWQLIVRQYLQSLEGPVAADVAADTAAARALIERKTYDLAVVDLSLLPGVTVPEEADELGLEVAALLAQSRRNQGLALLILTGFATKERINRVHLRYRPDGFLEKPDITKESFLAAVRTALLSARVRQAERSVIDRRCLTIAFNDRCWLGSDLHRPGGTYIATEPEKLKAEDLAQRTDMINVLLLSEPATNRGELWRPMARSIGTELFESMVRDRRIAADLNRALDMSAAANPLWLRFSGPPTCLGVPCELLWDGNGFLSQHHVICRELAQDGVAPSSKPEPFHRFVEGLARSGESLRILLVGCNSDGKLLAVDQEVASLRDELGVEARRLGLRIDVEVLSGKQASYDGVRDALGEGFQLLHYAGHGRFAPWLPEASGIVLGQGKKARVLTAHDLMQLTEGSELRLAYLSCCLSARSAVRAGRGDFHGMLDALVRADVPSVLGYRWTVDDQGALKLAKAFYQSLWKTLSPGRALLAARRSVAMEETGSDDETWASPVLVQQTA